LPLLGRAIEMEGLRKDGSEIPLEYSFSMHRDEKGGFSMAVIRDITERKKLEKERIEREKLSALMEMAGGGNCSRAKPAFNHHPGRCRDTHEESQ